MEQRKQRINSMDANYIKANENITTSQQATVKVMQILRTRVCQQEIHIDNNNKNCREQGFHYQLPTRTRAQTCGPPWLRMEVHRRRASPSLTTCSKHLAQRQGERLPKELPSKESCPGMRQGSTMPCISLQRMLGNSRTGLTLFSEQKPPLTTKKTLSNCRCRRRELVPGPL